MLKNVISSLTMAAIIATTSIYAQTQSVSQADVILPTTNKTVILAAKTTPIQTSYASAGQSGKIITPASESADLTLYLQPETAQITVAAAKPEIATAGATTDLAVLIEPSIKVEPTPSPTPVVKATSELSTLVATPKPVAVVLPAHELDALFQKYGTEYGVSWEKLKAIAKCESNFNAAVISKNGLYGGMYQYVASTWSGTRKQMGLDPNPDLRFNAEEAIRTTAFKIANGGIGAWPVCGKK